MTKPLWGRKGAAVTLAVAVLFAACSSSPTERERSTRDIESPDTDKSDDDPSARLREFIQEQNRVVELLYGYVRGGLARCVSVSNPSRFAACFERAQAQFEQARSAFEEWRPTVEPSLRAAEVDYTPRVIRGWLRAIDDLYAHEGEVLTRLRACLGTAPSRADIDRCLSEIAPLVFERGVELLEALGRAESEVRRELPVAP